MRHTFQFVFCVALVLTSAPAYGGEEAAGPPPFTHPSVTAFPLELPEVAEATAFEDGSAPGTEPYLVLLDADGRVQHGPSHDLDTAPPEPAGEFDLEAGAGNEQVLLALARGWSDGADAVEVLVRADRRAPWVTALWTMQTLSRAAAPPERWAFAAAPRPDLPHAVVRYDLPKDLGLPIQTRTVPVLLSLDTDAQGRRWFRVQEPHGRAFRSVKREIQAIEVGRAGADQKAADALCAYQADAKRGDEVPPRLSLRVELTPSGQRTFTYADVLPLLARLGTLDADIGFGSVPAAGHLEPVAAAKNAVARPVFGSKPDRSRGAERRRAAVQRGLAWLAAHQQPDGSWHASGFADICDGQSLPNGPDGRGKAAWDTGVTGLALLAFLGAGYTDRGEHEFARTVAKGLRHLGSVQDADGCFGPRQPVQWTYTHAVCTWAMVEAYGMTGSPLRLGRAQRGLDCVAMCRNPYFAWRYGVRPGDNDTSVTAWMCMAIDAGRRVNDHAKASRREPPLRLDEEAFDGAHAWIQKMTDPDYGRVGYIQRGGSPARPRGMIDRFPADRSEAMTAAALTIRAVTGVDAARNPRARRGLELLEKQLPAWNPAAGTIDLVYWFWGSMATWQAGSSAWRKWSKALDTALIDHQRKDTTVCRYRGSWDPIGVWGQEGGRVYATALASLALEEGERTARR